MPDREADNSEATRAAAGIVGAAERAEPDDGSCVVVCCGVCTVSSRICDSTSARSRTFACSWSVSVCRVDCSSRTRISLRLFCSLRRERSEAEVESVLIADSALPCASRMWALVTNGTSNIAASLSCEVDREERFCNG